MTDVTITDVRVHPGDSGFLLDDGDSAVLYDAGFAFTGDRMADKIAHVLGDRPLDAILLTHSHYDHALGAMYVKRRYPMARIVAGAYAAGIFAKPTARAVMRELDAKFAALCKAPPYDDLIDSLSVDTCVEDGDTVAVGDFRFTALSLPGHTRCSFGFYDGKKRLLLASESSGVYDGAGGVVPSYLVGYRMALDSIHRMKTLAIDRMLLPHYGAIEGDAVEGFLSQAEKGAVEMAERIVRLCREGKSDEEIYEDYKERIWRGYVRTIYPIDAMHLNTHIMISLIKKELLGMEPGKETKA